MSLLAEIQSQPEVLRTVLTTQADAVTAVAAQIRARNIRYVYLVARGTSEHAGIYGQYVLGALAGLPVALGAPSLFTIYERPPRLADALVIGVSQSGQSPDIVSVMTTSRQQGALTLAITNDLDAPLAQAAALQLHISAGPERAVAATKTYSATVLLFAMLAAALADDAALARDLLHLPNAFAAALSEPEPIKAAAVQFKAMHECVVLGRGYHLATALEWSLKLKELTYVVAERYSTAEFQHGPIALVEPGFPILAVAPSDPGLAAVRTLLQQLVQTQGADLLVLSDDDATLALSPHSIRLPTGVPPWLMPIVSIAPAQLFCYYLALARGLDPANPRGLQKVTRTR